MSESFAIGATTGLLVAISIVLMTGRGAFLIAGYNTMSKAKKARYDTVALCKFAGKITLPAGLLLPFLLIESIRDWYAWVYLVIITMLCIFAIVYANTGGRFRKM